MRWTFGDISALLQILQRLAPVVPGPLLRMCWAASGFALATALFLTIP